MVKTIGSKSVIFDNGQKLHVSKITKDRREAARGEETEQCELRDCVRWGMPGTTMETVDVKGDMTHDHQANTDNSTRER